MGPATTFELDDLDRRLLKELQVNNQMPMSELADIVHSSPATCIRRIKRMRDAGIIIADVSIVNPDALGRTMTVIVEVIIERERADLIEAFKRSVLKADQITHCYYVTGDADFVLFIHVANMDEYDQIISKLFHDNANIKQFKTLVAIRRVKQSTGYPTSPFA